MPLLEVWCETHDDITLIWQGPEGQEVEFVQVKSHELDQLWSVAKLCERERANKEALLGTSIFERSLANDRCCEPCRFRLVTCRPPSSSLGFLSLPFSAPDRMSKKDRLADLADDIDRRVGGFRSPKGNGALFWLANLIWEVRQSVESLSNDNNLRLLRLLAQKGVTLFPDQLSELYSGLLTKARDSALADWGRDPGKKKVHKAGLFNWLETDLASRLNRPPASGGKRVREKLEKAGVISEEIISSLESRQRYLSERFTPRYLNLNDLSYLEAEVAATLHTLRARLDAGEIARFTYGLLGE